MRREAVSVLWYEANLPFVFELARRRELRVVRSTAQPEVAAITGRMVCVGRPAVSESAADLSGLCVVVSDDALGDEFGPDYAAMAAGAVDHLRALGHRRVALLGRRPNGFIRAAQAVLRPELGLCEPLTSEAEVRQALASPMCERPTAWVVGSDPGLWGLLQSLLSETGQRLNFTATGPSACGISDGEPLALGQALSYPIDRISAQLAEAVDRYLSGQSVERRIRTRLARMRSLDTDL
jgi:hypothetical protein